MKLTAGLGLMTLAALLHATAVTAAAPAGDPLARVGLRLSQVRDRTVVETTAPGAWRRIVLPAEEGIVAHSLGETRLVGVVSGRLVIFQTDYDSRPNGGAHQCGAGTETVLRVVALRPVLRQTLHQRVESCWTTIEDGKTDWDAAARRLTVARTTYTPDARSIRTVYQVAADGVVSPLSETTTP